MKGPSGWAWSKPRQTNPNDRETVTYVGQNKPKPKPPDVNELKGRFARGAQEKQSSFDSHLRAGNMALRENRLDDARREYEKGLALHANDPDCHHRLAVVADKMGQFGIADDHYEAALKKRPDDPNLLSDMGYSFSLRGETQRAESTLKKSLAISPSHEGSMGNLGALYAKQGRYDDALAMFRHGAKEADAQRFMARLFPQGPGEPGVEVAGNTDANNPRVAQAAPADTRPDFRGMKNEDLKALMNREKAAAAQKRQQQFYAEQQPRRDWMTENPQQPQTPQQNPQNQPIVLGPSSNQQPNSNQSNQLPVVTPNGEFPGYANNGAGQGNAYGQGSANNGYGGPSNAQPGMNSNNDVWGGAGVQPAGSQAQNSPNGQRSDVVNVPYQQQFGGQQRQMGATGAQPGNQDFNKVEMTAQNLAAAQMGMNFGPGALFPVVPVEANSPSGFGPQGQPAIDSRFGAEFQSPPQFQNQPNQFQPNRNADPRQGAFNQNPRESFANYNDGDQLGPQSPASNWPVVQAAAVSPTDPSVPRFNDPMDRTSSTQSSAWAEKPSLRGTAPYNDAWPPASQPVNSAGANGGAVPNSVPMWNGGQPNTRPQPKSFGPATSNQAANYPEQWPGSRR